MPTYTFRTPEGQTQTIHAPRPLQQEELISLAQRVRRGRAESDRPPVNAPEHVLRAPSALDPLKMAAWEIPPLVGMLGGGLLGAPLGPLGSVGGAGLGYAGGRQFNRVVGSVLDLIRQQPPPQVSLPQQATQIVGDMATGAAMEALPGVLGRAIYGGPPSPTLVNVREAAQRQGIELTPSAARGSTGLAQAQALPLRLPLGRGPSETGLARARASAQGAAERLQTQLGGPAGLEETGHEIQQRVRAIARGQENAPMELVDRFFDDVVGTSRQGKLALGGSVQESLKGVEKQARHRASEFYHQALAERAQADVPLTITHRTAAPISDLERRLTGVQTRTKRTAEGLRAASAGTESVQPGDLPAQAAMELLQSGGRDVARALEEGGSIPLRSLTQDFINRYGLNVPGTRTLEETVAIQQRLRAAIRNERNAVERRQLGQLLNAVTDDLHAFGQTVGGTFGANLRRASVYFKREVAEDFARTGLLRRLLDQRPGQAAERMLTTKNPDIIQALMRRLPDRQANEVRRAVLEKIRERSVNVATGDLDPVKFESNLRAFGDENLGLLMGPKVRDLDHLRGTLTKNFIAPSATNPVFNRMLTGRVEGLVNSLTKGRVKSLEDLRSVYSVLEPTTQRNISRSLFQEVLENSIDKPTGQFSIQRFVTAKEAVPQEVWDTIIQGHPAAALRDVEQVYRHIIAVDRPAANPSGTGQAMLAAFQILELITGAGEVARGATGAFGGTPDDLTRGLGAIGVGVGVPYGLGRLLFSPAARRLLVPPLTAPTQGPVSPSAVLLRLLGIHLNETARPSVPTEPQ